jgi:excisionase family DNA binding protein
MAQKFYSVREVAELLGISRTSAYGLVRNHSIPSVSIAGTVRVPVSAMERFASRLEAEAMAGSAA